ncbi:PQQ-binding-like beta-propeller repeat protein [Microlunatus speluncae]|uniref:outer membrane protein assembly factor BamB family protein n=1 Tax=Microlunatus speluncae TaxID=2594267 RepID=UPI0013761424|nr:PQQ-binding-like beta-propeller repeat protein [Microlunatus speluncae]
MTWGTEDGTGRWSPFPVQDWELLPADPAAEPEQPRRPALRPLLIITACLVLLAGSIFTIERIGAITAGGSPYLPADGTMSRGIREVAAAGRTDQHPAVTEAAVRFASAMFGSTDFAFGTQLIGALDVSADELGEVGRIRLWRSILTTPDRQSTAVYRVDDGIDLIGEDRPLDDGERAGPDGSAGRGYAYRPGLTELPAGAVVGSTWRDRGAAGDGIEYASDFRAEAPAGHPAGCLQTSGRIRYTDEAGAELEVRRVRRVWCPGRGIVESVQTVGDRTDTVRPADWPAADPVPATDPVPTAGPAPDWTDPGRWRAIEQSPVSVSPRFGEAPMTGVPASMPPPVITGGGRLVRVSQTGQDLVVLAGEGGSLRSVLRLHPGGTITALAGFGRMIIVSTSLRQVIGYSDNGLRLWQRDLPEVAEARPALIGARSDDPRIALATIDGTVFALRLRTGEEVWRQPAGAQVFQAPVVAGDRVVVGGDDGTLTALAAADGAEQWSVSGVIGQPRVIGSLVITTGDGVIEGRDLADGRGRWRLPYAGTLSGTAVAADRLIVATRVGTMILDESGTVRGRLGPLVGVVGAGSRWAGWSTDRMLIMGADGTESAGWPLPLETWGTGTRTALVTPVGVQLHGAGWGFTEWAP